MERGPVMVSRGEHLPGARVRDVDQRVGPFTQGQSFEIDCAIFRYDDVHVIARGGHRPAQSRDDPRQGSIGRGRMARDDRSTAGRHVGAAHEIQLPAGAAELPPPHCFRIACAIQVNLNGRVDRDDLRIAGDDAWRIDVIDRVRLDRGIVVEEVV